MIKGFLILLGNFGSLIMGFGMNQIITGENIILWIILGVIGLIVGVLNYPVYAYIKSIVRGMLKIFLLFSFHSVMMLISAFYSIGIVKRSIKLRKND